MKRELYIYPHLISIYIYMDMDIILYTIVFYEETMCINFCISSIFFNNCCNCGKPSIKYWTIKKKWA